MSRVLLAAVALALVVPAAPAGRPEENKLPAGVAEFLLTADSFEVLSLDPAAEEKGGFHGYKVLGKTAVKADARKPLVDGLVKGMEGQLSPAKCFDPRHGVRATKGDKTVELVICFACSQFHVYQGTERTRLLVSKSPEPAFDKVLADAGIPKAK